MKTEDFVSELTSYWPKVAENKSISSSIFSITKNLSGENLKRVMQVLKESYSPSRTIGIYELKQILNNEGMTGRSTIAEKEVVDCDCCGNRFQYQMGLNDNCGLCYFPYEWTKMVIGYRLMGATKENNAGYIPKTIEDGYDKKLKLYREKLKESRKTSKAEKVELQETYDTVPF